jgi:hypothetical protein
LGWSAALLHALNATIIASAAQTSKYFFFFAIKITPFSCFMLSFFKITFVLQKNAYMQLAHPSFV